MTPDLTDAPTPTRKTIDAAIATTLAAAAKSSPDTTAPTPIDALTRVLETYRGIRPLLTFATRFPLIPRRWREALTLFIRQLDTLTLTEPDLVAHFKAGRDL